MKNSETDYYKLEKIINQNLEITKVAQDFMPSEPVKINPRAKWGITYHSIYSHDSNPSFKICERYNIFKCFSTGKSGSCVRLYMDIKHVSREIACKELINHYDLKINVPREEKNVYTKDERSIIRFLEELMYIAQYNLEYETLNYIQPYRKFVEERGYLLEDVLEFGFGVLKDEVQLEHVIKKTKISKKLLGEYNLINDYGFVLMNRLLIPIYDSNEHIVSISGRTVVNDEPKYKQLNAELDLINGTHYLYNLNKAYPYIEAESRVYIVEGYFDVLRLWKLGIKNVVRFKPHI